MASLLIAVVTIAFLALILAAGMNYVSFDSVRGIRDGGQVEQGFIQLATAYLTFQELHRDVPESLDEMIPALLHEPRLPEGLAWVYDEVHGNWFCASGVIEPHVMSGLKRVQQSLPEGTTFIGEACGATANALPDVFPAPVAITYHVRRL